MSQQAQHLLEVVRPWVDHYGYAAAFFGMMLENAGIPVPAETFLIGVSLMASQGLLDIRLVILLAVVGDVVGDSIGFAIGRYGGRRFIARWGHLVHADEQRIESLEALYARRGGVIVFSSQFFAATRIAGAIAAGLSNMRFERFVAFDFVAATIFISGVSLVVFKVGDSIGPVITFFSYYRWVGVALIIAVVAGILWRPLRHHSRVS